MITFPHEFVQPIVGIYNSLLNGIIIPVRQRIFYFLFLYFYRISFSPKPETFRSLFVLELPESAKRTTEVIA